MNYLLIGIPVVVLFFAGVRIVRPTHRGLIERLGKYRKLAGPGFHWIIPVIDRLFLVNITSHFQLISQNFKLKFWVYFYFCSVDS